MFKKLLEWDKDTFIYLNNLGIESYDAFWSIITRTATWIPLFLFFIFLLFLKFPRKQALPSFILVLLLEAFVLLVTHFTKEGVARLRPSNNTEINTLIRILQSPTDYSFFSGHAASSFAITTIMVLLLRRKLKWVWVFYVWPLLFSTSRIYVGVHFPMDILVGALVGVLSAFGSFALYNKVRGPYLG